MEDLLRWTTGINLWQPKLQVENQRIRIMIFNGLLNNEKRFDFYGVFQRESQKRH